MRHGILATMAAALAACMAEGAEEAAVKTQPAPQLSPIGVDSFFVQPEAETVLRWSFKKPVKAEGLELPVKVSDYEGKELATLKATPSSDGKALELKAAFPAGYCELSVGGGAYGVVSLPLREGGADPFFAIDTAMSSLSCGADAREMPNLFKVLVKCGISMSRDRLLWSAINPEEGRFVWDKGRFKPTREAGLAQGVRTLELFHDAPKWAVVPSTPFPSDMLATMKSWEEISKALGGTWGAIEIWNEPNLQQYPADLWSSMMKASAHGVRKAHPEMPCGGGAFSNFDSGFLENAAMNGALRHLDFVSFHTYAPPPGVETAVRQYREWLSKNDEISMPLWLTEAGRPWPRGLSRPKIKADSVSALDISMQAVVAKACGVGRHFAFIFGFYNENSNNFGMMGQEKTPLRSMAAYANTVRRLSGKDYIGDVKADGALRAMAFATKGGRTATVVAWSGESGKAGAVAKLEAKALSAEGIDGRPFNFAEDGSFPIPDGLSYVEVPIESLGSSLNANTGAMELLRVSKLPWKPSQPQSPLVLRNMPEGGKALLSQRGYMVSNENGGGYPLKIRLFNLSASKAVAELSVAVEREGKACVIASESRSLDEEGYADLEFQVDLTRTDWKGNGEADVLVEAKLQGSEAVPAERLCVRFLRPLGVGELLAKRPANLRLPCVEVQRWEVNACQGCQTAMTPTPEGGIKFDFSFNVKTPGGWAYPKFTGIPPQEAMSRIKGVIVHARAEGASAVRIFADLKGGARFLTVPSIFPPDGKWHSSFIPFDSFDHFDGPAVEGGKVDPTQIEKLEFGVNTKEARVSLEIGELHLAE